MSNYKILTKDKQQYISYVLLNEIINFQHYFPINLSGDDLYLAPYLEFMKTSGVIEVKDSKYIPTSKGREMLVKFYDKYYEFLKMFDVFCAVDLEKGEFAFSSINNDWNDDLWNKFINSERFSDVRVAVCEFKKINPVEIVFMSFLQDNRFDCTVSKWQNNLTADAIWTEIEEVCNTAISAEYLTEQGVIEDVIKKGTDIAMKLIKEAEEASAESEESSEVVEEVTTTEEYVDVVEMPYYGYGYWDPYYDPYYCSPLWLDPILFY